MCHYLRFVLSVLGLAARVLAHAVRRRGTRSRRYIDRHISQPPRPHLVTGPIPIVWPSGATGVAAPMPPPEHPRVGGLAPVVPMDPYRRRARRDASRRGLVVLIALARQAEKQGAAA